VEEKYEVQYLYVLSIKVPVYDMGFVLYPPPAPKGYYYRRHPGVIARETSFQGIFTDLLVALMQAPKNTYANDTPNTIARSRDGAGCEEKILEKLQDAVARVRRDRDDLRRKRDIAAERLRLKSGKKEAMEANSRKVQESINKAREGVGERAKREIAELQLDVERLEKEVSIDVTSRMESLLSSPISFLNPWLSR
jgi:hypothetical protein